MCVCVFASCPAKTFAVSGPFRDKAETGASPILPPEKVGDPIGAKIDGADLDGLFHGLLGHLLFQKAYGSNGSEVFSFSRRRCQPSASGRL